MGDGQLDFIVAGGARYGLGHVMRSSSLAAAAVQRGLRVRTFLAGDRTAARVWRLRCPESGVEPWSAWRPRRAAAITIFDHPFAKGRWLTACRAASTRSVVLDDPRASGSADLTINPGLHHLPDPASCAEPERRDADAIALPEARSGRVLCGPRYAILDAVHLATSHEPLAARHELLLSLGGADPHRATPRLAPILTTSLLRLGADSPIATRRVVLGPAFPDPEGGVARALAEAGWQVERALPLATMAARMAAARLAVMGFGTSLCELAWHGTPHLSLTHHEADAAPAQRLESQGIGRWLGHAGHFDVADAAARFETAVRDVRWQTESAQRAQAALEGGRGCERVLDRIDALAREPATSRSERRGDRRDVLRF